MGRGGVACPKPEKGSSRRRRLTLRLKLGKAMRDAVWLRANGCCEACGTGPLFRGPDILHQRAGHVAHNEGRNVAPHNKFNPDAARLLCRTCHLLGDHGMRF